VKRHNCHDSLNHYGKHITYYFLYRTHRIHLDSGFRTNRSEYNNTQDGKTLKSLPKRKIKIKNRMTDTPVVTSETQLYVLRSPHAPKTMAKRNRLFRNADWS